MSPALLSTPTINEIVGRRAPSIEGRKSCVSGISSRSTRSCVINIQRQQRSSSGCMLLQAADCATIPIKALLYFCSILYSLPCFPRISRLNASARILVARPSTGRSPSYCFVRHQRAVTDRPSLPRPSIPPQGCFPPWLQPTLTSHSVWEPDEGYRLTFRYQALA